ncbi:MAG: flagellar hook-associated protein FlgK [Spirochaetes bacterium]|nr:flagellar hook-associated protein FlgK [Spirochaetota bacterium]
MASTFMGIELGKRGIIAHQQAIQTAGHNVTNAETEGYSRQRVILETEHPLYDPSLNREQRAGQIGQGTIAARIERIRNAFIDDKINNTLDLYGYWKTRNDFIYQAELVHNEPTDLSLRTLLDNFWASWEELANNPSELSVRKVVKERAVTLMESLKHTYNQLKYIQDNVDIAVVTKVNEINGLGKKIRDLNVEIQRSLNLGDMPNDLMDKRDLLVERLSQLVNIEIQRNEEDEFIVYIRGEHFVQGPLFQELTAVSNPAKDGYHDIYWKEINLTPTITSGEMKGLLEIRDDILKKQLAHLNNFAVNLTDLVNEIHRDSFAMDGVTNRDFFRYLPATTAINGDYDSNNDGTLDSTALFKMTGIRTLDPKEKIGTQGVITFAANSQGGAPATVNYFPGDTVEEVIDRINKSNAEVVSYLDHRNRIVLKSTLSQNYEHFIIRHVEDSGDFLAGVGGVLKASGAVGAYDWARTGASAALQGGAAFYTITPQDHIASWGDVNSAIKNDVGKIAAAWGTDSNGDGDLDIPTGVGDGTSALRIAELRYKKVMIGDNATFDEYYTSLITETGSLGEQAKLETEIAEKLLDNYKNIRQSLSGVNLDEEMANLVMFQHGYNASARVVSIMDHMLDTIINRMGV